VAIKFLGMIIFAALFLAISASLFTVYQGSRAEQAFQQEVELLAQSIRALSRQDVGSKIFLEMAVPQNCELKFENHEVIAIVNGVPHIYDVGIFVSCQSISVRKLRVTLERLENEVRISG
jgi:hypothetical protein